MYVLNYNSKFPSNDYFCSFVDFKKFVRKVVQSRFHLKDDRDSILKALNELEKSAPFSITSRFPVDYYFHVDYAFQKDYLLPLRFLINEIDENGTFSDDLKEQLREILYKYQQICEDPRSYPGWNYKYLYNRGSFESHFGLLWND